MSRRHVNWPERLNAAIDARRNMPGAWGSHDCCLFACDIINELVGIDPAADLRGTYDSALSAVRVLKANGGVEVIAETRCAANGFKELPSPNFAQRGDLVLTDTPRHGPALGICVGRASAFVGESHLEFYPMASCRRAWRTE